MLTHMYLNVQENQQVNLINLDMKITLSENEIYDETSEYEALGISEEKWYIPTIHLYFNDDLTFA